MRYRYDYEGAADFDRDHTIADRLTTIVRIVRDHGQIAIVVGSVVECRESETDDPTAITSMARMLEWLGY